jgi:hypothetical protein
LKPPAVDEPQDIRVLQSGDRLDFAQEALGADHGRKLRPQHLVGDLALVLHVEREAYGGHAAGAERPLTRDARRHAVPHPPANEWGCAGSAGEQLGAGASAETEGGALTAEFVAGRASAA